MFIPCVSCGKRQYTEESPLWFHCEYCLSHSSCYSCGQSYKTTSLEHGICKKCIKTQSEPIKKILAYYYCDGCGQDFPSTHLEYVPLWEGHFCNRCIESEVG